MKYLPLQNSWLSLCYLYQQFSAPIITIICAVHLHNYQDPVQNENLEPLVQKQKKKVSLKDYSVTIFYSSMVSRLVMVFLKIFI